MKLLFISDIHGSLYWLNRAIEKVEQEQPDQIILLGDYMYHGPRNPLPDDYNPAEVANILNRYKNRIIAVRGNCDAEVDQMLLEFPMMGDYAVLYHESRKIHVTHGHGYSMEHLPPLQPGDIFIQGHTHIPVAVQQEGIYLLNPGSIALPKGDYPHSYGIMENDIFTIHSLENTVIKQIIFED
ncbi:phosphodiesterase [Paenibacillus bovis]|uniref:Phosphoesterase n=1 Tax=Paenibacillus bovis TaxID=1616788 RepID=A0A172ZEX1_9BACL|nr:phosphodiesterase [Paenibacillus bovis]ANF96186.1 YfcE family phosphodiesterase [Paenibacillus bovis]